MGISEENTRENTEMNSEYSLLSFKVFIKIILKYEKSSKEHFAIVVIATYALK